MMNRKKFWTADPIQTLKDAVNDGTEMIVLPRHFVEQLLNQVEYIQKDLEFAQKNEIWGFYEDEFPIYTDRQNMCPELSSPMTVAEANGLINEIKEIYRLAKLRNER